MTARDMPHFNCGCLLFTPAVAWGTTLFLPICAHSTKGLGCVCSLDLWKAPVPQPAAQMTGAMQSWPVGMYKLVPVSVACVGSSLLACPSETSQDSTMGSSMARGRRGENVGDSGCAQRGLPILHARPRSAEVRRRATAVGRVVPGPRNWQMAPGLSLLIKTPWRSLEA